MGATAEGHAAGMINDCMVIYGRISNSLFSDVYSLNIKNFIWDKLIVTGTSPEHRELWRQLPFTIGSSYLADSVLK